VDRVRGRPLLTMKEIVTDIDIEAAPETVWHVLTDFRAFPSWNPFIVRIAGDRRPGARLEVRIEPPGARGWTFRPRMIAYEPNRELRWIGRVLIPGLFDGEHVFLIEPRPPPRRVRFTQREAFSGVLVPLVWNQMEKTTRRGFEDMNRALKTRAEQ
jgi:hypothetical protein